MDTLNKAKDLIFIDTKASDSQVKLIENIVEITKDKLLAMLPKEVQDIPQRLEFVVIEVAIKRFNRIGSEGMSQESVDGRSQVFNKSDFEDFIGVIDAWIDDYLEENNGQNKLRFL